MTLHKRIGLQQTPLFSPQRHAALDCIIKHTTKGNVLDLGAGYGDISAFFARKGYTVRAVEKDPSIIRKHYPKDAPIDIIQCDVRTYQPQTEFKVIIVCNILCFLSLEQSNGLIDMVKQHLEDGGFIYISGFSDKEANMQCRTLISQDMLSEWLPESKYRCHQIEAYESRNYNHEPCQLIQGLFEKIK
jgi:2-polyprenyl-3-methyl-5-hydroxy-6-metoxy-1,4-benzoquinol methylase